jgi:hypothetical protein
MAEQREYDKAIEEDLALFGQSRSCRVGSIVLPIPVLAPGSALGSRPRVALSSAQVAPVYRGDAGLPKAFSLVWVCRPVSALGSSGLPGARVGCGTHGVRARRNAGDGPL